MNLLNELRKHDHLKWGDPDNPDDEDAVVYLCKLAVEDITRLTAENAALREYREEDAETIVNMAREIVALREYVEIVTDGGTDYPETWDELQRLGIIVQVKPTPEFIDEWGDDADMWVLAWKADRFDALDAGEDR